MIRITTQALKKAATRSSAVSLRQGAAPLSTSYQFSTNAQKVSTETPFQPKPKTPEEMDQILHQNSRQYLQGRSDRANQSVSSENVDFEELGKNWPDSALTRKMEEKRSNAPDFATQAAATIESARTTSVDAMNTTKDVASPVLKKGQEIFENAQGAAAPTIEKALAKESLETLKVKSEEFYDDTTVKTKEFANDPFEKSKDMIESAKKETTESFDAIKSKANAASTTVKTMGEDALNKAQNKGEDLKVKAEDLNKDVRGKSNEMLKQAQDKSKDIYGQAKAKGEELLDQCQEQFEQAQDNSKEALDGTRNSQSKIRRGPRQQQRSTWKSTK